MQKLSLIERNSPYSPLNVTPIKIIYNETMKNIASQNNLRSQMISENEEIHT